MWSQQTLLTLCIVARGDLDNVCSDNLEASKALHDLLNLLWVGGHRLSAHRMHIQRLVRTRVVMPPISGLT